MPNGPVIIPGAGPRRTGIVLPDAVRHQMDEEAKKRQAPPQGFQVPPQMAEEAKKLVPQAEQVNALLEGMVGEAATVALLTQPNIRRLLQDHLHGIMPQLSVELCRRDRIQLHQTLTQVAEDRKAKAILKKEKIDPVSYNQAVSDYYMIISQIPVPTVSLGVTAPILDAQPPVQTQVQEQQATENITASQEETAVPQEGSTPVEAGQEETVDSESTVEPASEAAVSEQSPA